jgi:hypothetical protein
MKWKVGPDLKHNAIKVASTLSSFTGVNSMSVHEVEEYLDTSKSRFI